MIVRGSDGSTASPTASAPSATAAAAGAAISGRAEPNRIATATLAIAAAGLSVRLSGLLSAGGCDKNTGEAPVHMLGDAGFATSSSLPRRPGSGNGSTLRPPPL